MRKPAVIYRATRIRSLVTMIDYSDENFRHIVRNPLYLDFNKRGIPRTEGENNILGYALNENVLLNTHITGGLFVQLDWP